MAIECGIETYMQTFQQITHSGVKFKRQYRFFQQKSTPHKEASLARCLLTIYSLLVGGALGIRVTLSAR